MMNQPIFDMRAVAALDATTDAPNEGFLASLMASLRQLPELGEADLADELRERAATYEGSQPSYAADLRAAVSEQDEPAVA